MTANKGSWVNSAHNITYSLDHPLIIGEGEFHRVRIRKEKGGVSW